MFCQKFERETMKKFEGNKEQNEAKHGEKAINGMHVLVIPFESVDSMLHLVVAPYWKQRTGSSLFHSTPAIPDTCYT